jgi:ribonuclease HI
MGDKAFEKRKLATIHFDGGGMTPGPVVAACIVELTDDYEDVETFDEGTHNVAEYQALMLGLRLARKHGAERAVVMGDSRVVVNQINGEWKTRNLRLRGLRNEATELLDQFESWSVKWIERKENWRADQLGRRALTEYKKSGRSRSST